jgi:hypothetical protein
MSISFWSNDPYILFKKDYIFDLWPTASMSYEEKLNAITRLIIFISIVGYILTMSMRILVVGIITLIVIFLLFTFHKQKITKGMVNNEAFTVNGDKVYGLRDPGPNTEINNTIGLKTVLEEEFKEGNKKNPFSNVLLTQINDEPNRLAAPPAFNPNVEDTITKDVKKAVQFMNPDINNTDKQLFGSLWENFRLDNSNRVFYSTPNTRVTNDQTAYAKYLYGDMPSAKGSTMEDNIQREKDNYRYTLY